MNAFQYGKRIPQGLKPAFLQTLNGTAEAVPYPKPIYETSSNLKVKAGGSGRSRVGAHKFLRQSEQTVHMRVPAEV
jgi:hypothetical protein